MVRVQLISVSQRYMFVEFRTYEEAEHALASMHNHPFDARHTFKVNHFTDIERYEDLDETYVEPELEDYAPRVSVVRSCALSVF